MNISSTNIYSLSSDTQMSLKRLDNRRDYKHVVGYKTHREIFAEYARNVEYHPLFGREDWRDYLNRVMLSRCDVTGLYGEAGTDVVYVEGYDADIIPDQDVFIELLADRLGWTVYTRRDPYVLDQEVYRVVKGGAQLYREFSASSVTRQTAQERCLLYLERRAGVRQ